MPHEPADGFAAQRTLAAYIRDPERTAAPDGIEARRLKVYRELFLGNVESLLAGNFPVIRRILDGERWQALVRDFYREHRASTPLFTELAREFLRFLEQSAEAARGDAPWLAELAHYEWIELALQISEAREDDVPHDPDGDLLAGVPVLSPLAWPLAYEWPVHRLGPDHLPDAPPAAPTLLLVQREPAGGARFHELTPLAFRLLQRLDDAPGLRGREQLEALAREAGVEPDGAFLARGAALLAQLRDDRIVLGTRRGRTGGACAVC